MRKLRFSQTQIIALGFFLIIGLGTFLLTLPVSTRDGTGAGFREALFTATSASCVTGLVVRDTYTFWSPFGQAVILVMIQLGGLGFMTVATFFSLVLRRRIGIRERELLSESINSSQIGGIVRLTRKILIVTAICELGGAALLAVRFCRDFGFAGGLWTSLFVSVSAFCNAGFDLLGRLEPYGSLVPYMSDVLVNIVVMVLITVGGLGFLVWDDVLTRGFRFRRYSLHTKIVLVISAVLTFGGALLFLLLERENAAGMDWGTRILTALFDSVTARTAGFNSTDTAALSPSGKLLTMLLMFIGGSPGSTAGGIKTTTVTVLLIYAFAFVRREPDFGAFGRRLEDDSLKKASAVFFTNLLLALAAAIAICALQSLALTDVLFETFSAIGTVGMTTGITRELLPVSQMIIAFLMYCGRVGSLSFAMALSTGHAKPAVMDPVEKITIG